tara:strand:+ start:2289 stop:3620 length:1332 start_codon:yes stop_codon:yes gene_type:complete
MSKIKFVNHSSFLVETSKNIFLCDPWYEGSAFFNGWNLVSQEINNSAIIKTLSEKKKNINIWYSHEHSDHFSVNFLKSYNLKDQTQFFYKKTSDKRVFNFIRKNFKIKEIEKGEKVVLDEKLNFKGFPYKNTDDSFCYLNLDGKHILNLNDCVIKTKEDCDYISDLIKKKQVDYIFVQFSYATWRASKNERQKMATDKIQRLKLIFEYFKPTVLFPFASYIYFSHEENQDMNDSINTPSKVYNSNTLKEYKDKIVFLKPMDEIDLNTLNINELKILNLNAVKYWEEKYKLTNNQNLNKKKFSYDLNQLEEIFNKYIDNIKKNYLFLGYLLESFGFIKPFTVKVSDLNKTFKLSYKNNLKVSDQYHDIECTSEVLFSMLKFEYGWDGVKISGRFNSSEGNSYLKINRFFFLQSRMRNGQTLFNLTDLIKYLLYMFYRRFLMRSV